MLTFGVGNGQRRLAGEEGNRKREGEQQEQQSNHHTLKMVYITSFILFKKSKSKITVLSINFRNLENLGEKKEDYFISTTVLNLKSLAKIFKVFPIFF